MTRLAPLLLISVLSACAAQPSAGVPAPDARMSVSERLYFGRDIEGGGTVSHEEWAAFVREVAAPRLPGMAVWGAAGAWRDPASGAVVSESTFVVEVVHRGDRPTLASLDEVAREYLRRFRQRAVLRTTHAVRERSYAQEPPPPGPPAQPRPVSTPGPRVQFLTPPGDWPYPFSPAVRVGDLIFVSGQIGSRTEGGRVVLVPGGIEAETRQTLDNVREILERAGSSLDRVVKCTVMMADMAEWPRMNTIYATYFPGPKPARSALGANGLALGARVEIECIAAAGRG